MSSQKIFFFLVSFTSSCDVRCTLVEREGRGSIKKIPQPIRISITTVIDFLFVIFILWTQNLWGSAHFVFFILCALSIAYLRKKWKNVLCHCIVNGSYAMHVVSIFAHCISSWYEENMLSKNIYFLFILTARIKSKGNIKIKEKESGSCIYNAILTSFMSCCFLYSWFYHFSIIWFNLRQCISNCVSRHSKIFFKKAFLSYMI